MLDLLPCCDPAGSIVISSIVASGDQTTFVNLLLWRGAPLSMWENPKSILMNVNYFYRSTTIIIPDLLRHVKSYYQDFKEAAETEGARRATGVSAASLTFYTIDCISSLALFLL